MSLMLLAQAQLSLLLLAQAQLSLLLLAQAQLAAARKLIKEFEKRLKDGESCCCGHGEHTQYAVCLMFLPINGFIFCEFHTPPKQPCCSLYPITPELNLQPRQRSPWVPPMPLQLAWV